MKDDYILFVSSDCRRKRLLPITAASITKVLKSLNKGTSTLIVLVALIVLAVMGTLSYFSRRNFQSIPASENKAGAFLLAYLLNTKDLYLGQLVMNIFTPLPTNTAFMQGVLYSLYSHYR